jgi:hypothetical protein
VGDAAGRVPFLRTGGRYASTSRIAGLS